MSCGGDRLPIVTSLNKESHRLAGQNPVNCSMPEILRTQQHELIQRVVLTSVRIASSYAGASHPHDFNRKRYWRFFFALVHRQISAVAKTYTGSISYPKLHREVFERFSARNLSLEAPRSGSWVPGDNTYQLPAIDPARGRLCQSQTKRISTRAVLLAIFLFTVTLGSSSPPSPSRAKQYV